MRHRQIVDVLRIVVFVPDNIPLEDVVEEEGPDIERVTDEWEVEDIEE